MDKPRRICVLAHICASGTSTMPPLSMDMGAQGKYDWCRATKPICTSAEDLDFCTILQKNRIRLEAGYKPMFTEVPE